MTEGALPESIEQWQKFLEYINKSLQEADQDRALMEHSQELSSHEMSVLFKRLENAQHIVHLGTWSSDCKTEITYWSAEMYRILEISSVDFRPSYKSFLNFVHPEDQTLVEKAYNNITLGKDVGLAIRVMANNKVKWVYIRADTFKNQESDKVIRVDGTLLDITEQKEAEMHLAEVNSKLVIAARRVGMAEVATSVLHNIGNVLNSVNVSVSLVQEKISQSSMNSLKKVVTLFQQHANDIADFISDNPQGKLLPEYLCKLAEKWEKEQNELLKYLTSLHSNVQHIKDVVSMQQSLSGVVGLIEPVQIPSLLEDALVISEINDEYTIEKQFDVTELILADKIKLLQILVNLVQNAKGAILEYPSSNKKICLSCTRNSQDEIIIKVMDTGIGIKPENLTRIFNYGFTTKKEGHGFGLHISALSAREMGGSLIAESKGVEQGATFTLKLPYKTSTQKVPAFHHK